MNQCYVVASDNLNEECHGQSGIISPFGIDQEMAIKKVLTLDFDPYEIKKLAPVYGRRVLKVTHKGIRLELYFKKSPKRMGARRIWLLIYPNLVFYQKEGDRKTQRGGFLVPKGVWEINGFLLGCAFPLFSGKGAIFFQVSTPLKGVGSQNMGPGFFKLGPFRGFGPGFLRKKGRGRERGISKGGGV